MIIEHREPSDHYEGLIMDIPITNSPIHGGWSFHKPYTMQLDHGTNDIRPISGKSMKWGSSSPLQL